MGRLERDGAPHVSVPMELELPADALLGRAETCSVRIEDPVMSRQHARVAWDGTTWTVEDVGSFNGTWVDGRRLAANERVPIGAGTKLRFGERNYTWTLAVADPPEDAGAA